jgi:CarD family transcriptional regulator
MATSSKKSSQGKNKTSNKSSKKTSKKASNKTGSKSRKSRSAAKDSKGKGLAIKKTAAAKKASQKKSRRASATSKAAKSTTTAKRTTSTARRRKLRYKKGQEIVYPLQGVGQIQLIEERTFRNTKLLYYIIYLEVSDMTIMVPVDKADELGIRPIVDKRQANKALKLISEDYEPVPTDWKARYQNNLDLLKKGSVLDIATVVRALYHRSRIKELPILERKLYDSALKLLVDEISFSLQKGKEEVEELVLNKMEVN